MITECLFPDVIFGEESEIIGIGVCRNCLRVWEMKYSILLFIAMFVPTLAIAGPLEEGKAALDHHNFKKAIGLLAPLAESGNVQAQWRVDEIYMNPGATGEKRKAVDVKTWHTELQQAADQNDAEAQFKIANHLMADNPPNYPLALKWLQKAAANGDAITQSAIGNMYYFGSLGDMTLTINYKKAREWYQRAADQGVTQAQVQIGRIYNLGRGVRKNDSESLRWMRKAAERGDRDGMEYVANYYEEGLGTPKDNVEAYFWYTMAEKNGSSFATKKLAQLNKQIPQEKIASIQKRLAEWKPVPDAARLVCCSADAIP